MTNDKAQMTIEIPNPKHQIPNKHQVPNSKHSGLDIGI
jgi:hypothetical protein